MLGLCSGRAKRNCCPTEFGKTSRSFSNLETIRVGEKSEYTPNFTPAKKGGESQYEQELYGL